MVIYIFISIVLFIFIVVSNLLQEHITERIMLYHLKIVGVVERCEYLTISQAVVSNSTSQQAI